MEAPHKIWATLAISWPCRKKVKHQGTTILLAILVDLPSLMIPAKVQPQGILGSGEEDF